MTNQVNTYPGILVQLFKMTGNFDYKMGDLLHQFTCTRIGEIENGMAKAFYVDNYESFKNERSILHKGYPDLHFSLTRYVVNIESVTLQWKSWHQTHPKYNQPQNNF
jgi:hypothetical protein